MDFGWVGGNYNAWRPPSGMSHFDRCSESPLESVSRCYGDEILRQFCKSFHLHDRVCRPLHQRLAAASAHRGGLLLRRQRLRWSLPVRRHTYTHRHIHTHTHVSTHTHTQSWYTKYHTKIYKEHNLIVKIPILSERHGYIKHIPDFTTRLNPLFFFGCRQKRSSCSWGQQDSCWDVNLCCWTVLTTSQPQTWTPCCCLQLRLAWLQWPISTVGHHRPCFVTTCLNNCKGATSQKTHLGHTRINYV